MGDMTSAAAALGRRGGEARAARMTPEERSEAARKAVSARWARAKQQKPKQAKAKAKKSTKAA